MQVAVGDRTTLNLVSFIFMQLIRDYVCCFCVRFSHHVFRLQDGINRSMSSVGNEQHLSFHTSVANQNVQSHIKTRLEGVPLNQQLLLVPTCFKNIHYWHKAFTLYIMVTCLKFPINIVITVPLTLIFPTKTNLFQKVKQIFYSNPSHKSLTYHEVMEVICTSYIIFLNSYAQVI